MSIDLVGASRVGTNVSKASTGSMKLQDQFMQILLTQLRYQDPMAPMQEKDFFAQMAQFTTAASVEDLSSKVDRVLAEMTASRAGQDLLTAARLIGNLFQADCGGEIVTGVVESVAMVQGRAAVAYQDMLIPADQILAIGGVPDAD